MYNEFKSWLDTHTQDCTKVRFHGYVSNRRGRVAQFAQICYSHKNIIMKIFDDIVDLNSNKLILDISTYIQSERVQLCTEIYSDISEIIIFPSMSNLVLMTAEG